MLLYFFSRIFFVNVAGITKKSDIIKLKSRKLLCVMIGNHYYNGITYLFCTTNKEIISINVQLPSGGI